MPKSNEKMRTSFQLLRVHTLEETARHFGVTRQSIRATENRALAKLRRVLEQQGFCSYAAYMEERR